MELFFKVWTALMQYIKITDANNIRDVKAHDSYIFQKFIGKVIPVTITKDPNGRFSLLVKDVFLFPASTYPKLLIRSLNKKDPSYYEGFYLIENLENLKGDTLIVSRGDLKPKTKGYVNLAIWSAPGSGKPYKFDEKQKAFIVVGNNNEKISLSSNIEVLFYRTKFFVLNHKIEVIIAFLIIILILTYIKYNN